MPEVREMLRIGQREMPSPFVLAPMAGYTDAAFRRICQRYGASLTFTEMVNAMGVAVESPRSLSYLEMLPGETAVAAHIYGSDPEVMGRCSDRIASLQRFAAIDINAGCPMPKIVRNGAGVALMEDPERLHGIVASVCSAVDLPVTVKTRLGIQQGQSRLIDLVSAAAEAGASAVSVHARYAEARHGGRADWSEILRAKHVLEIPVIGNGGVTNAAGALELLRLGLDGVMIGRAAIGRPWIFAEANALRCGVRHTEPSHDLRRQTIEEHLRTLAAMLEHDHLIRKRRRRRRWDIESTACRIFRRHLIAYLADAGRLRGKFRHQLMILDSIDAVLREVDHFLASLPVPAKADTIGA